MLGPTLEERRMRELSSDSSKAAEASDGHEQQVLKEEAREDG